MWAGPATDQLEEVEVEDEVKMAVLTPDLTHQHTLDGKSHVPNLSANL